MCNTRDEKARELSADAARDLLITALIDDGLHAASEDAHYLRAILRDGCQGFRNMGDGELVEAAESAGLFEDRQELQQAANVLGHELHPNWVQIHKRADDQVYGVEHNGDCWQAVFPSDEAEHSELFADTSEGRGNAIQYVREFLGRVHGITS